MFLFYLQIIIHICTTLVSWKNARWRKVIPVSAVVNLLLDVTLVVHVPQSEAWIIFLLYAYMHHLFPL